MLKGVLGVVCVVRELGLDRWLASTVDGVTMLVNGVDKLALRTLRERSERRLTWAETGLTALRGPFSAPDATPAVSSITPFSDDVCERGGVG